MDDVLKSDNLIIYFILFSLLLEWHRNRSWHDDDDYVWNNSNTKPKFDQKTKL